MSVPFTVAEIREAWLSFFASKGCVRYPSGSLVPENDPTTLFTVAGMSQFKDMFLGRGTHPFTRATTVQKCIRTNDIMNVGRTARHHTFFEMLGNFSFNDYFKRETIGWAWEFLTQVLKLDPERLSISVHTIDDEAYDIWTKEIGIPAHRIFRMGDNDNFWPANAPKEGPEGPGGCCSEIFWDHRINSDPTDNLTSNTGRFVEIWNLVFPQFNVRAPHPDGTPNLEQLGRTNIDTGSGLERVAAVLQGVYNNFDIDVFQTIIRRVCQQAGVTYDQAAPLDQKSKAAEDNALIRRIADHVRATTFCIADGALPGNSDRGYIVRRLIRRATLDLEKLGCKAVTLHTIVPAVVEAMGVAYPEVAKRAELAQQTLLAEETLFRKTLSKGLDLFQKALDRHKGGGVFGGDDAFDLVTTHGFPKEVIAELAQAEGLTLDEARFTVRWAEFQKISQGGKTLEVFTSTALQEAKPRLGATPFTGYDQLEQATTIALLEVGGKEATQAATGTVVRVALAKTPFYAESGGQVGDRGLLSGAGFTIRIDDTQKDEGLVIHLGTVTTGTAIPGPVTAHVDETIRSATTRHHSATHLLHSALGRFVSETVEQQGSKVSPEELRFDFNHAKGLTTEQLAQVEDWVNAQISAKHPVSIREMSIAEAKATGAKALFGEKYGSTVRVVGMGPSVPVSVELCGGCHVANTGDIHAFRILKEEGTSAGIRRLTGIAGAALAALQAEERATAEAVAAALGVALSGEPRLVGELARFFKCQPGEVVVRVAAQVTEARALAQTVGDALTQGSGDLLAQINHLQEEGKRLRKLQEAKSAQLAAGAADGLVGQVVTVAGISLLAAQLDGLDGKALRTLTDTLRRKLPAAVLVLGSAADGKVALIASVPVELTKRVSAGALIQALAPQVGGKGGGKPDLAQAGGSDPAGLPGAIVAASDLIAKALAGAATSA